MLSAFISHNFKDKPLARRISSSLEMYGIKTWIDEAEIKVGDSLIDKICDGIDSVDYLIALLSENSVNSKWVKKELDIAINDEIEKGKVKVIPVLAGKCELPKFLKGKLYIDMSTNSMFKSNLPNLLKRFDVDQEDTPTKLLFTSKKLSVVEIINILSSESSLEKAKLLNDFSYSDNSIFEIETFVNFFKHFIEDNCTNDDLLLEIINVCIYFDNENVKRLPLNLIFERADEATLIRLLQILSHNRTSDFAIELCVWNILSREDVSHRIIEECLLYFSEIFAFFNLMVKDLVINYCYEFLETDESLSPLYLQVFKIFFQHNNHNDNKLFKKIVSVWNNTNNKYIKESIALALCEHETLHCYSPRLRYQFKRILLESIDEDDLLNAKICISLLINEELNQRSETWLTINSLDDFSVISLFDELNMYRISQILTSNDDVEGLKQLLTRNNKELVGKCLDIIAVILVADAYRILEEVNYTPKYYTCHEMFITILQHMDSLNNMNLYVQTRDIFLSRENNVSFHLDRLLVTLCDTKISYDGGLSLHDILSNKININIELKSYKKDLVLHAVSEYLKNNIGTFDVKAQKNAKKLLVDIKKAYSR